MKKDKITKALVSLKNALAEAGVDGFQVHLFDIEDANKLGPLFKEDARAIRPPASFHEDKPFAFWSHIEGVMVRWPNKQVATHKGEDLIERRRERARVEQVQREADRVAQNARSAHLAANGVSS